MDDLHGKIMNIPCDESRMDMNSPGEIMAYKLGHRDARHAAAELAAAALSQPAAQGEWIDWAGGFQPVADRTEVDIRFRDGSVFPEEYADEWIWTHGDDDGDIVAYRIAKATP